MRSFYEGREVKEKLGPAFKNILLISACIFICVNLRAVPLPGPKAKIAEKDCYGYYEVPYVEETPPPSLKDADKNRGFVLFVRSYMERIYRETVPKQKEIVNFSSVSLALGEYEPVQIGIYPLVDLKSVKFTASDLVAAQGNKIDKSNIDIKVIRYLCRPVGASYMNNMMVIPKTIEKMEEIDINRGVTRGLWITVKAPFEAKPGKYKTDITLSSAEKQSGVFELEVEVLPFEIKANPKNIYCTAMTYEFKRLWELKDKKLINKTWEIAGKLFADMKEHGMTTVSPESQLNYEEKDGHPSITDLEAVLKLHKKIGFSHPVIYYFGPMLKTAKAKNFGSIREYNPKKHPERAKKMAEYYTAFCKKNGYPGVMLFPVDEPGLADGLLPGDPSDKRQKIALELCRAIKEGGGETCLIFNSKAVEILGDIADTWILSGLTAETVKLAREKGKKAGYYPNAAVMGNGTVESRLSFGFYPWAFDLDAVTPWTNTLSPFRAPGDFLRKGEGKYRVIDGYLGMDGKPITNIQWELVREGIDDAKYLYTLETALREVKKTESNPAAVKEAEDFLFALKKEAETSLKGPFDHFRTGELLEQPVWKPAKFEETRKRMVELVRKLKLL
ncbi:MAG: glycoside hydrolase domain-containing protein [Candidatus Firestonebacteria bacterium]